MTAHRPQAAVLAGVVVWTLLTALAAASHAETVGRVPPGAPPASQSPTPAPSGDHTNAMIPRWQATTGSLRFNGVPAPASRGRPAAGASGPQAL